MLKPVHVKSPARVVPFHLIDPVCSAMHLVEKPAYAIDELAEDILNMRVDDTRRQECCQSAMVGLTRQLIEAVEELRRAIDRAAGEQTNERACR